jgi:hypothetical protein
MTYLERRYPAEFSLRRVDRDSTEEKQPGAEIPIERLQRYGRLALELAAEDQAREAGKTSALPDTLPEVAS